jgi:hypothetical protein
MPKIYLDKKLTFRNLDSLTNHQIKTINILHIEPIKQDSSALKRLLVASYVEAANPNNPIEIKGN